MENEDIAFLKANLEEVIEHGRHFKDMAENPTYREIFNIQNTKEYALGIIVGLLIQLFDTYIKNIRGRQMNDVERAVLGKLLEDESQSIMDSLFK